MSLSSPDSATYTTFDSSPSPNSSATSVSNEEDYTRPMDPTAAIPTQRSATTYDYSPHQHDSFSGTNVWNSVSKKSSPSSQQPLTICIPTPIPVATRLPTRDVGQARQSVVGPDDGEWARSQTSNGPPPSATSSNLSPLQAPDDFGQGYTDYTNEQVLHQQSTQHPLAHSQSLPHISRYPNQQPRNPPYPFTYSSEFSHLSYNQQANNIYAPHPYNPTPTAPCEVSPTHSPLLSPFVPNDQHADDGITPHSSYTPFVPMDRVSQYTYNPTVSEATGHQAQDVYHDNSKRRSSGSFRYDYSLQYKQTAAVHVHAPPLEEQEQSCLPQYVSGHEIGGIEIQNGDAEASPEGAKVDKSLSQRQNRSLDTISTVSNGSFFSSISSSLASDLIFQE
ncbi:hypothetical protein F5880DRAFT_333812 [Lentinula raphanica]|nr:hypothetical protein F5880DRAFT_333812 [Lentinula raphanica]